MTTLSNDPTPRELIAAAAAGALWALLGLTLVAHGSELASCRVQNALGDGSTNFGSGTLIDVTADNSRGLVLSCAHLFTEGQGRVVVAFADGRSHGANVLAIDSDADLSALEIGNPREIAAPIGTDVDGAATLTACGFGPNGQFRCVAGRIVGVSQGAGQVSLRIAGAVRSGDSGGGVFDPSGRLVGVVWGESGGVTYASSGGPLRQFLARVMGRGNSASTGRGGTSLPVESQAAMICPNGRCPLVAPSIIGGAPAPLSPSVGGGSLFGSRGATSDCDCQGQCVAQWAAVAARLDALEAGKQDRGDYLSRGELAQYARTGEIAILDQQNRERHQSLVDRIEALGPLIGAAARATTPLAATALGISGPVGWGIVAATTIGGWLIGRRLRRGSAERGPRGDCGTKPHSRSARPSSPAPSQEATAAAADTFRAPPLVAETHQPIEREDREARELLRLSQLEGRDPLQDAVAGRLALDRLDAAADGDSDAQRARWADELRRELRERFNDIAPTKFEVRSEK